MTAINSNTNALLAQRSPARAERATSEAMEQLSTGRHAAAPVTTQQV
jgi:flagellin-like hook-associated protein FlgL